MGGADGDAYRAFRTLACEARTYSRSHTHRPPVPKPPRPAHVALRPLPPPPARPQQPAESRAPSRVHVTCLQADYPFQLKFGRWIASLGPQRSVMHGSAFGGNVFLNIYFLMTLEVNVH